MDIQFERDIVGWVADAAALRTLHAYRSPVIQAGATYCMAVAPGEEGHGTVSSRRLKGVTTLMRELFYASDVPRPGATPAARAAAAGERRAARKRDRDQWGVSKGPDKPSFTRPTAGVGGLSPLLALRGFERGTLIHQQIEDAVLHDADHFARRHPHGMHPWARSLMRALLARGLRPFKSEFIVHDPVLRLATKIDLVAVDQQGRLVFIENKTGYAGAAWHNVAAGGPSPSPKDDPHHWRQAYLSALAFFPCTARNRAVVQSVLGALMAVRTFGLGRATYRVAVARVDDDGVDYVAVTDDFVQRVAPLLYATIADARKRVLPPGTRWARKGEGEEEEDGYDA